MRKTYASLLVMGLLGSALTERTSGSGLRSRSSEPELRSIGSAGSGQVQITGLQVLFRGQPVEQLVRGKRIKKYSLEVTGSGFLPGSSILVDSRRAYPVTLGEPPQQPLSTSYISATNLEGAFLSGKAPEPGFLSVRVVNPGGAESNVVNVDVISKPTDVSIASITPQSGPVGTQVTLTGVGFMVAGAPDQAAIRFSAAGANPIYFEGFYTNSVVDGETLKFVVPNNVILPICPGGRVACDPLSTPLVTPQQYRVWVINPNGMSNDIMFSVTSN